MSILSTLRTLLSTRQEHLDDHLVLAAFNNEHPVTEAAIRTAAIAAHAAGADPHPNYLTQAEGDTLYGGGGGIPAATEFTSTTMPNPVAPGDMTVAVFPGDTAALAIARDGDVFPRWLLTSDPQDGFFFGDGSIDPYNANAGFFYGDQTRVVLGAAVGNEPTINLSAETTSYIHVTGYPFDVSASILNVYCDIEVWSGDGIILHSPNTTKYRITVNDDGSLSTTVVP